MKSREFWPPPAEKRMNWPRPRKLRSVIDAFDRRSGRLAAGRIAAADREFAGRLLDHVDDQDDLVGLRARGRRNFDGGEEIERFEAALGALHQHLVEGIALADVELAANHEVARAFVAANFDALDIGARTLVDRIDDGDGAVLEIAVAARRDLGEGIAQACHLLGQGDDGVLDVLGAIDVAGLGLDQAAQTVGSDAFDVALDGHVAERVALAFLDREVDDVFVGRRVEIGGRGNDPEIRIAVVVVEAPQRFLVGPQPVLGIDVVAQEIGHDRRALGRDDVAEAPVAVGVVAVEVDCRDLGAAAFVDLEDDVDPVFAEIHDLGRHAGVVAADLAVGRLDRLDVAVEHVLRERAARLELHGGCELGVLELLVALEKNLVDHRIFVDLNDQRRAELVDAHVGKQAGAQTAASRPRRCRRSEKDLPGVMSR